MANPEDVVQVVCGVIFDPNANVLLTQRKMDAIRPALWEYPGGKVEPGETLREAVLRELHEELGVAVWPYEVVAVAALEVEVPIRLTLFRCEILGGGIPQPLQAHALMYTPPDFAIQHVPQAPSSYLFYRDVIRTRDAVRILQQRRSSTGRL